MLLCLVLAGVQTVCFGLSLWVHWRSWHYRQEATALLATSTKIREETSVLLEQLDRELAANRGEAAPPLQ
jgi:hypothetical protein